MDNSFQTSFIPKKPITTSVGTSHNSAPISLLTVISVIILIVVGGSSAGLYLYKNYLIKEIETLSSSLKKIGDSFEKGTIEELALYDKRITSARTALSKHIVLSPMFKKIGELTLPSIQYTKFDHQGEGSEFSVSMSGTAPDYKSIALQADVFNADKGRYFKNVVFSNLVKEKNKVKFDIKFNVDKSLLSYEENNKLEDKNKTIESSGKSTEQVTPTPAVVPPENTATTTPNTTQTPTSASQTDKVITPPVVTTPTGTNTKQP